MSAAVETLYRVSAGDSLSKIAERFYGDAARYPEIARLNNIPPTAVLYIGQALRVAMPATSSTPPVDQTLPSSPGGSAVDPITQIETVTVSAYVWWKDWRWYAGIGAVGVALWYLSSKKRR